MQGYRMFKQLDSISELELSFYEEVSEIPENEDDLETTVSYVKDTRDGKLYIKKEIKNGDTAVFNELLRFEEINERKLPGVPKLLTVTDDGNTVYTIEEFINYPTLKNVMDTQAVTAEELAAIFREVTIILEKLHKAKNPIVHGDISSKNILVDMDAVRVNTKEQKVYLVDFNRGKRHMFKADISEDIKRCCNTLRECMDTLVLKSITEFDGAFWEELKDIAENGPHKYSTDRGMMIDLGRLIGKRAANRDVAKKKSYMLPGFRTKKIWKMGIATAAYAFMMLIVMFVESDHGLLWSLYYKACALGFMFSFPAWISNYMGVRDKYSWLTGKNVAKKLVGHIIAVIAIFGFWMMLFIWPELLNLF